MNESLNPSAEQSQSGSRTNQWEKMAEEVGPFQNKKEYENQSNSKKSEIIDQKEIDGKCIQIIRNLLDAEALDPRRSFDELEQYAEGRAQRLGADNKINIFLRYEYWRKKNEHLSERANIRYNPKTDTIYNQSDWRFDTRAYHSFTEGTFIDFQATMNGDERLPLEKQRRELTSSEKAYAIIDYAYTCEHELTHDIQQQRLDKGEISFDALRTARDHVVLSCLPSIKNGNHFYTNAHNDFFIETEANQAADDFLSQILPIDGTTSAKIANPGAPEKFQRTMGRIFDMRSRESRAGQGLTHTLSTKETSLRIPSKEYSGAAEEIISDFCDDAIKAYPGFLTKYPALLLEYNKDGTRRSREDIEAAMKSIDDGSDTMFDGRKVDSKRTRIAYYKLLKNSKKLSKETDSDDDMKIEQMPAGKTKEQVEAEVSEKKHKEEEEYQKRFNEYWERKRQAEQKQREENERQIKARQEVEAERQRQVREAEEVARRNMEQEQFEEEQEEGMSM